MKPRTSDTHPLQIAALDTPGGGRIGMTFCPGKRDPLAMTGPWARDLDTDLAAISALGCVRPGHPHGEPRVGAPGGRPPRSGGQSNWARLVSLANPGLSVPSNAFETAVADQRRGAARAAARRAVPGRPLPRRPGPHRTDRGAVADRAWRGTVAGLATGTRGASRCSRDARAGVVCPGAHLAALSDTRQPLRDPGIRVVADQIQPNRGPRHTAEEAWSSWMRWCSRGATSVRITAAAC